MQAAERCTGAAVQPADPYAVPFLLPQAQLQLSMQPRVDELLQENGDLKRQLSDQRSKLNRHRKALLDAEDELAEADNREEELVLEAK